ESNPTPQALDKVHRALDAISRILAAPEIQGGAGGRIPLSSHAQAVRPLGISVPPPPVNEPASAALAPAEAVPSPVPGASEKTPVPQTVRIAVAKLDAQLLEAEEMLAAKLTTGERAADLGELVERLEDWKKEWATIQPEVRA